MEKNVRHSCREPLNSSATIWHFNSKDVLAVLKKWNYNYERKIGNIIAEIKGYWVFILKELLIKYYSVLRVVSIENTKEMLKKLSIKGLLR